MSQVQKFLKQLETLKTLSYMWKYSGKITAYVKGVS